MKIKAFIVLGFLVSLLAMPLQVMAQAPAARLQPRENPIAAVVDNRAVFTLAEIGYRERDLVSPVDVTRIRFNVPPSWHLLPEGEIELQYDVLLSGADANSIVGNKNPYGGNLIVTLNDYIIGSLPLDEVGTRTARLKIPAYALVSRQIDGSQLLAISLNAQFSCAYDIRATVTVKGTSFFDLTFEPAPLKLDLSKFPAPFYISNSFVPESTLIVVPDDPDPLELQAAMDVMAGFGSMIGGDYNIDLINTSQLAQTDLTQSHLIFVGMPGHLNMLSDIQFQLPVVNGQFANMPSESVNDGVIQLAYSPWNSNKAVMLLSGNSAEAVVSAAQAVSTGKVLAYKNPALAYVSKVELLFPNISAAEDFSLQNLGYVTQTLSGVGVYSTEYKFLVSKEQVATKEGYLDLVYYHAGSLDSGISSVSFSINNQIIASAPFTKESEQVTTLRIKIPTGTLQFGENLLQVTASMPTYNQVSTHLACDRSGMSKPWLVVSDQTSLHIPKATDKNIGQLFVKDFKIYPDHFTTHSDLNDIAFVVSKSDPISWRIASKLAFNLGDSLNPQIPSLVIAYADNVPQDARNTKSLIIVGLANQLPLLTEFNDMLPAPFDFAKNIANERNLQVSYRIPANVDVGYLELMASPFNSDKTILVVAGNTAEGLMFAGNGLLASDLRSQLTGVFAVTNGTQVATGNTSSPVSVITIIPSAEPVTATPIPGSVSETPAEVRPSWPMPVIVVSSLIILAVIGVVIKSTSARNRPTDKSNS